jgi:hypothetical protein
MTAPSPHDQIESVGGGILRAAARQQRPKAKYAFTVPRLPDARPILTVLVPVSRRGQVTRRHIRAADPPFHRPRPDCADPPAIPPDRSRAPRSKTRDA